MRTCMLISFILTCQTAWAQQKEISGRVTDAAGDPLPGVTVQVQGTAMATSTDGEGSYRIGIPEEGRVLEFSFVGFSTQVLEIGEGAVIDVQLQEDVQSLEELVIVGYGAENRENLTGAVSQMDMDNLASRPITNASVALQGQMPGVYALQVSGKPGDDQAVLNIRGIGTLNNSDPLVLIDGVPGNMNDLNPQDIESISVLKDAASAAIYGNRAANGVVLVTTKTGREETVRVNYHGYYGVQQPTALPEVFNSVQYATLHNEASVNSGMAPVYTEEDIRKYQEGGDWQYPDMDYYDLYYSKARMQNHHVNVTGGSDNLRYVFSLGYLDQEGILIATDYHRLNFRSNFDASFLENDRLKLSAKIFGKKSDRLSPFDEWGTKWYAGNAPIYPLTNPEGEWVAVIGERNFYGETTDGSTNKEFRHQFNGQLGLVFEIASGLNFEATYAYNYLQTRFNNFQANVSLDRMDGGYNVIASELTEGNNEDRQTMLNALLRYRQTFGKHQLNLLGGYQEEEFSWDWADGFRRNFVNNIQRELNVGDPSTMTNTGGAYGLGLRSYFARVGYTFNDRYLFEANIRRDGSSRFTEEHRWGTFPSFSAGWKISEEGFMQNLSWLDMLKIRGSWGRLGNQNIGTDGAAAYYPGTNMLTPGQNYGLGGSLRPGAAVTALANPNTTWETTTQTNIGVDLALFRNFDFTIDLFDKVTDDILMQIPIPVTMGALGAPFQNVGKVSNKGIEFVGNYRTAFSNGLTLSATLNLSHIKNEILDLYGRSPIITDQTALVEGAAVNAFYGYQMEGIYQIEDFIWQQNSDPAIPHEDRDYVLRDGVISVTNYQAQPGDLKFVDISGDGTVTMEDDRTVIGKQFPDLSYALQLNLDYKGFDLGLFLQGVQGIDGYTYSEIATPFSNFSNNGIWWLNRWTPDNPSGTYPRLTHQDARKLIHSEFYMEDASYLRLKNLEIGYTLPERLTSGIHVNRVRFYVNAQNLFTITDFRGFDPEQPVWETRAQSYPQVRIFTMGIQAGF